LQMRVNQYQWYSTYAAGGAGVLWLGMRLITDAQYNKYTQATTNADARSLHSSVKTYKTMTDISMGLFSAFVVTSAILYVWQLF
jgi:hypothetical protein